MFVAKVTGSVVATQKVDIDGRPQAADRRAVPARRQTIASRLATTGRTFVAVDTVGAGEGEFVLITQGSSARLTPETKNLPIDTVIIGIVDTVHVDRRACIRRKSQKLLFIGIGPEPLRHSSCKPPKN